MISGVLETVQVQLFYGSKEVRYGMEGVDLSEFSSVVKEVKRADERSGGGMTNWLYNAISLDSEQYGLSVMTLFNRSTPPLWELMTFEGTRNWSYDKCM
jgi:hypothetical protein